MTGDRLSPLVRELACLTLGHVDADRTECVAPIDSLVGDLVREVRRLRVITGDDGLNLDGAVDAVGEGLLGIVVDPEQAAAAADELLDGLASRGWALVKVDQR